MDSPKSNKSKIWVIVAILATAAIVGGGVYYSQNKQGEQAKSDLQDQIDTLRSKLAAVPTPSPTPSATSKPIPTVAPTPTPATTDATIAKNTAIADAETVVGVTGVTATISATSGSNFSKVNVAINPGGYSAILKKVNGIWVVVTKGQAMPSKAEGTKYGLPAGWYSTVY